MSAESPSSTAPSLRRLPFTIRLSPPLVNRLLSRTQRTDALHDNIHGLLFGLSDENLLVVQAFRPFGEDGRSFNGKVDRAQQDELFEQLLTTARKDSEISPLELVGWYAVRANGGLLQSDIQFHDWYFKRPGNLALVLKPEGKTDVLWEMYCRSANGSLSDEVHRWGTVRLTHGSPLTAPVEVTMRAKVQDDFFMRAYEATSPEEEGKHNPRWKRVVRGTTQKALGLFSGRRQKTPQDSEILQGNTRAGNRPAFREGNPPPEQATVIAPQELAPGTWSKGEMAVPAVSKPLNSAARNQERAKANTEPLQRSYAGPPPSVPALGPETSARRSVPWISSVVVFAVAAGLTFGLIYKGVLSSGEKLPGFLNNFFPAPKLGLHLESQGDRVLLSWNSHHPAVRNSKGGVLQIDDGAQHRRVDLDAAQVSNGSVLYRPNSDDVTFRFEVEGAQGGKVSESMRVLETVKPSALDLSTPAPNSSASRAIEPPGQESGKGRVPVTGQVSSVPIQESPAAIAQKPGTATVNHPATQPVALSRPLDSSQTAQLPPAQKPLEIPGEQKADTVGDVAIAALPPAPVQTGKSEPAALEVSNSAPETTRNSSPAETNTSSMPVTKRQHLLLPPIPLPVNTPAPAVGQALNVSSSYHAPRPLRQVLPNVALLAPAVLSTAGRVEVIVKVDEHGRVTEAHLAEGTRKINSSLAGASIFAAKQWTFEPATLSGKVVPSQHSVVFQFQSPK